MKRSTIKRKIYKNKRRINVTLAEDELEYLRLVTDNISAYLRDLIQSDMWEKKYIQ